MSADGEIDIKVQAEGTDGAASELADSGGGGGGVGGGGSGSDGGKGGLRGNLRSGALAGALISALGPLLNILDPIHKLLQAFLAPIAVIFLRLMQPVLRGLIQLIPLWFGLMDFWLNAIDKVGQWLNGLPARIWNFMSSLPGMIWNAISSGASWLANGANKIGSKVWSKIKGGASWITNGASNIGSAVWNSTTRTLSDLWDAITSLPGDIGRAIAGRLPNVDPGQTASNIREGTGNRVEQAGDTVVEFSGGLGQFVENAERSDTNILP